MNLLSHRVVLAEAMILSGSFCEGLTADDLSFDGNTLKCKNIPGGISVEGHITEMSLNEFSRTILVPWLQRMTRLKLLRADLKELGIVQDDR